MKVKFKPAIENPPELPEYQTNGAAGMDIRSAEDLTLWGQGDVRLVSTGYFVEIDEGFEGQIRPRSGLAFKHKVTVLNAPGTIDSDFRGELKVLLINHSDKPFSIAKGDRIAQLVVAPVTQARVELVVELSDTDRGQGGFGSTGV